jgi:predicted dehydrogenase
MNILILGCGSIGERHLKNLLAIAPEHSYYVFDIDRDRLASIQSHYPVRTYHDLEEALSLKPDLSLICLPNHLHVSVAQKLARLGSHLFIEKPISDTLEGVDALIAEVDARNLLAMVACNMRFHPAIMDLHEAIKTAFVGEIWSIRASFGHYLPQWRPQVDYRSTYSANRAMGGGILRDAIHEIDYLNWFGGSIESVYCAASTRSNLEIDVEDCVDLLMRFSSGLVINLHLDYLDKIKRRGCEIVGSAGTAVWQSLGKNPEIATVLRAKNNESYSIERLDFDQNQLYIDEMKHLLLCIQNGTEPLLSLRDASLDLKIVLAAELSSRSGNAVQLSTLSP